MHLTLNGRIIGICSGFFAGLLFVLFGWRLFLILLAFTLFGLLVGLWMDTQPGIARQLRETLRRLFLN
ncbi:MAG: hypothetical protein WBC63_06285 [Candidatus Bipolaricaulia bacterium]